MEQKTATGTAAKAFSKKLETPITYDYTWTNYSNISEMRAAGDMLSDDEQVKARNEQRQMTARSKAQTAAFEAAGIVKPTAENDPQVALRDFYKTLTAVTNPTTGEKKYTPAQAREMAATMAGAEWDE